MPVRYLRPSLPRLLNDGEIHVRTLEMATFRFESCGRFVGVARRPGISGDLVVRQQNADNPIAIPSLEYRVSLKVGHVALLGSFDEVFVVGYRERCKKIVTDR